MLVSVCGLVCNKCEFFNNLCSGCYHVAGKTFWAEEATPEKICPLYNCAVLNKKLNNCGECRELPCNKFIQLKDPNITEEEHQLSIKNRVNNLRSV